MLKLRVETIEYFRYDSNMELELGACFDFHFHFPSGVRDRIWIPLRSK